VERQRFKAFLLKDYPISVQFEEVAFTA